MANWAQNSVTFQGTKSKIKDINTLFEKMIKDGKQTGEGQLPLFVRDDDGYFFNISIDKKEDESIELNYETRWAPNVEVLIEIANHFNLDFEVSYHELCMSIFGKATYIKGNSKANIIELNNDDFDKFEFLEDSGNCLYNNKEWEYYEMLEFLLEEKSGNVTN